MLDVTKDQTRYALYNQAVTIASEFCTANGIHLPVVYTNKKTKYRGYFMPDANPYCVVNMDNVLTPRFNPTDRNQSFPGHKTDTTVAGVLAHEVGHHVDYMLQQGGIINLTHKYRRIKEAQVTSYDTTPIERVAEALRLFILNPDLLRRGRPRSYEILSAVLRPIITLPWYYPFNNPQLTDQARAKYIHYCNGWILRGVGKKNNMTKIFVI